MSIRTTAIAEDFPHFDAWYGNLPDFRYLKSFDKFHCRDEWFKLRQLVDMRYYAQFQYTESENYGLKLILSRIEQVARCRRIKKLPESERPEAYRNWFSETRKTVPFNDVWEYREQPVVNKRLDASEF